MSKCNVALLFFNFKKNLFSIFVVSLIMFLVACTQHYQTLSVGLSVCWSVCNLFVFSCEPRLYKKLCPSVCRSVKWLVGWSVHNSFVGVQRQDGERLLSCIRTCFSLFRSFKYDFLTFVRFPYLSEFFCIFF